MTPRNSPPPEPPVVLVADDEEFICQLARVALEAAGFLVLTAKDGEEALKLSRSFPGIIHVLVSDIVMPKVNGLALREQILRERPRIQVLLMSGQTEQRIEDAAFLPKPFKLEDLKQRVRQLLGRPPEIGDGRGRRDYRQNPEVDAWAQVGAAREDLTNAMSHYKDLLEQANASGWRTDPDGTEALRQAANAERRALQRYARLLDAFTRLVLRSRPSSGNQ